VDGGAQRRAERPPVLIYRDHLLPYSEVWVRLQGEALKDFRAYYAGSKRRGDVEMPHDRTFVVNGGGSRGRAAEGLFKVAGWAPRLHRWARQLEPALVHAHFGVDGALVAPLARALNVPLVVTFHGFEATMRDDHAARSFYLHRKYLRRRDELARSGALFVAVSRFVRDCLLAQGFPAERTVTQYIGIDASQFRPDPAARANVVLFVGRFDFLKGAEFAIRATAEVVRSVPDAELVLIGDGPRRAELEALAAQLGLRCRFLGFQPQASVKTWLNCARILCVPSITIEDGRAEAFGLAFLEAQAMGVPVVSFASGGIPEAVAHGVTGFLAAERDWQALAGFMARLFTESGLWDSMSRAGQARVRADFDLHTLTRGLEDLYRAALRDFSARAAPSSGVAVRAGWRQFIPN
jgi:glycosyltransferase involved in cell wall biosynthesis